MSNSTSNSTSIPTAITKVRPTFSIPTELGSEEIIACLKAAFRSRPDEFQGQFIGQHAIIWIVESKRHFWSPWINLEIRETAEANEELSTLVALEISDQPIGQKRIKREVFGRFSPNPAIWTAYMFFWLAIGVLVFFAAMFGISQQLMGLTPWAYWLIPAGFIVSLLLWLTSQAGQKLAYAEMEQMRGVVEACLEVSDAKET